MRKRLLVLLAAVFLLAGLVGVSQASLVTIGTASYGSEDYKLIYDDDDTGYGGGGLVWLDYTHSYVTWQNQVNWASGLGASLTVTLDPGYTTDIDWTTGWRLPDTVDGLYVYGYKGDPNNDGIYDYTWGYNLANSEMGHLFYTELGNTGYRNTDGSYNTFPPEPDWFLQNTGDFDHLFAHMYWSGTEHADSGNKAWEFSMPSGFQHGLDKNESGYGLAVRSGQVSVVPVPGAIWLFGSGLIGLATLRRRKKGNRV